jgi:hypothetical protein
LDEVEFVLDPGEFIIDLQTRSNKRTGHLFRLRIQKSNNKTFISHADKIPRSDNENWPLQQIFQQKIHLAIQNIPQQNIKLAYCIGIDDIDGRILQFHWEIDHCPSNPEIAEKGQNSGTPDI